MMMKCESVWWNLVVVCSVPNVCFVFSYFDKDMSGTEGFLRENKHIYIYIIIFDLVVCLVAEKTWKEILI